MSADNSMLRRLASKDDGATTVVFAIVVLLLFGFAALGVELTNMYTRDRAVQTTADLAALSGAQGLPDTCQAFAIAYETLGRGGNNVQDDGGSPDFDATVAEMTDGALTNGEIQILRHFENGVEPAAADLIPAGGCPAASGPSAVDSGQARFVRVITPPRSVAFNFAGVFSIFGGNVSSSGEVRAAATAGIASPQGARVLPIFLPGNCGFGPNSALTENPSGSLQNNDFSPSGSNNPSTPGIAGVGSLSVPVGSSSPVSIQVSGLEQNPNLFVPPSTVGETHFDFTLFSYDEDGNATRLARELVPDPTLTAVSGSGPFGATFTVTLPIGVRTAPGTWIIRVAQPADNRWTPADRVGQISVGEAAQSGCGSPSTGSFGSIDSPRLNDTAQILRRNLALGLDHALVTNPRTPSPPDAQCTSVAPDLLDNVSLDGRNCLNTSGGISAGQLTDGLVSGGSGYDGRLDTGGATPSDLDVSACSDPDGDTDFQWTTPANPGSQRIINTVLSCYLEPTFDLADVQTGEPGALRIDIFQDPRFFFVPVLHTLDRPPNGDYPIREFRAAFITNETAAGPATCASTFSCNGVDFQSGQVRSVQVFVFPTSALPESVVQPGNGDDFIAGTRDVLLVG